MTSLPKTSPTTLPFPEEALEDRDLFYHRQRLKNRLFEVVLKAFIDRYERNGFTKAHLASRMKRDPAQINRWLKGPKNWTLETISDILLALQGELELHVVFFEHKPQPNFDHELALDYQGPEINIFSSSSKISDLKISPMPAASQGILARPKTLSRPAVVEIDEKQR